jgi:hypothetical protein
MPVSVAHGLDTGTVWQLLEPGVRERVEGRRQGPAPEVLGHFNVGLAPGIGCKLGVEVAATLVRAARPEWVIEGDDGPPAGPEGRGEGTQRNAPVCDVVQRKGAGDAAERPGFQRQWPGQVGCRRRGTGPVRRSNARLPRSSGELTSAPLLQQPLCPRS